MTNSVAFKISSSNDTTTVERKKEFRCPVTASEAYNLGLAMEKVLGEVYSDLETRCKSAEAKKMLKDLVKQNHQDVADFMESFKFSLNCEIGAFYQACGVVFPGDISEQELVNTQPLITRNLENFFLKINTIQNDLKGQTNSGLGEYFNTKTGSDVYTVGISVRSNSSELYERLAKLYPEGKIKQAFEEMAQIIDQGNLKLSQNN